MSWMPAGDELKAIVGMHVLIHVTLSKNAIIDMMKHSSMSIYTIDIIIYIARAD